MEELTGKTFSSTEEINGNAYELAVEFDTDSSCTVKEDDYTDSIDYSFDSETLKGSFETGVDFEIDDSNPKLELVILENGDEAIRLAEE